MDRSEDILLFSPPCSQLAPLPIGPSRSSKSVIVHKITDNIGRYKRTFFTSPISLKKIVRYQQYAVQNNNRFKQVRFNNNKHFIIIKCLQERKKLYKF